MAALNEHTTPKVRHGQKLSAPCSITFSVRKGCILAPALFCVAIDWILNYMTAKPGTDVSTVTFSDLVYADNTALHVTSAERDI